MSERPSFHPDKRPSKAPKGSALSKFKESTKHLKIYAAQVAKDEEAIRKEIKNSTSPSRKAFLKGDVISSRAVTAIRILAMANTEPVANAPKTELFIRMSGSEVADDERLFTILNNIMAAVSHVSAKLTLHQAKPFIGTDSRNIVVTFYDKNTKTSKNITINVDQKIASKEKPREHEAPQQEGEYYILSGKHLTQYKKEQAHIESTAYTKHVEPSLAALDNIASSVGNAEFTVIIASIKNKVLQLRALARQKTPSSLKEITTLQKEIEKLYQSARKMIQNESTTIVQTFDTRFETLGAYLEKVPHFTKTKDAKTLRVHKENVRLTS